MRIATDYKHAQKIIREQDAEIDRLRSVLRLIRDQPGDARDCRYHAAHALAGSEDNDTDE